MSVSDIDIINLALGKIGADPIVSILDVNKRAQIANRTYAMLRDALQRKYRWNFTRVYTALPALATPPPFEYEYAYQLPTDYLRLELATQAQPSNTQPAPGTINAFPTMQGVGMPGANLSDYNNSRSQDYRIVGLQIYAHFPPPLSIIYAQKVDDPNQFDAAFVECFAAYLAKEWCMNLTESAQKKAGLQQDFQLSLREAIAAKSVELPPETIPDDTWMLSRIAG